MATQFDDPRDANLNGPQANGSAPAVAIATPPSHDTDTKETAPHTSGDQPAIDTDECFRLVEVLKANLANAGLYRPATDGARASHDDATILCVCPSFLALYLHRALTTAGVFCALVCGTSKRPRNSLRVRKRGGNNTTSTRCSNRSTRTRWSRHGDSIRAGRGAEIKYGALTSFLHDVGNAATNSHL